MCAINPSAAPTPVLLEQKAVALLQLADALLRCPYSPFCLTPIQKLLGNILPINFPQQWSIMASPKAAKAASVAVTSACKLANLVTAMLQEVLQPTDQNGSSSSDTSSSSAVYRKGPLASSSITSTSRSTTTCSSSTTKVHEGKKNTTTAKEGAKCSKGPGDDTSTACTCGKGNAGDVCPACGPVVESTELTSEGWPAWLWYKVQAQPWVAYTMLRSLLSSLACRAQSILVRYVAG